MTSKLPTCEIYVSMQVVGGVQCRYPAEDNGALGRRFVLEGLVDRSEDELSKDREPIFGGSEISVEICAPREEWLEEGAAHEGLASICGTLKVMANLQPQRYGELGYDEWFGPTVQARLFVDDQTFDRLEKHLADADRRGFVIDGRLDLSGSSLPKPESILGGVRRQELVSDEDRIYAIVGFDLGAHRRRFRYCRARGPRQPGRYSSPCPRRERRHGQGGQSLAQEGTRGAGREETAAPDGHLGPPCFRWNPRPVRRGHDGPGRTRCQESLLQHRGWLHRWLGEALRAHPWKTIAHQDLTRPVSIWTKSSFL